MISARKLYIIAFTGLFFFVAGCSASHHSVNKKRKGEACDCPKNSKVYKPKHYK